MSQLIVAKNRFNFFIAAIRGVNPTVDKRIIVEIFCRLVGIFGIKGVYYNQLYFHSFGNEIFYINAGVLPGHHAGYIFGKTGKVRLKLNKNSVTFDGAYNSGYGFSGSE